MRPRHCCLRLLRDRRCPDGQSTPADGRRRTTSPSCDRQSTGSAVGKIVVVRAYTARAVCAQCVHQCQYGITPGCGDRGDAVVTEFSEYAVEVRANTSDLGLAGNLPTVFAHPDRSRCRPRRHQAGRSAQREPGRESHNNNSEPTIQWHLKLVVTNDEKSTAS